MFPVLFSVGSIAVSSYGVFLAMGFLLGIFLVWRLCRAWDMDEEKLLDLAILTFLGGLIGARLYFVFSHLQYFTQSALNLILINKVPGFSFWGGLLGGWLALGFFARRFRSDFWFLADIAVVGLLGGLILSDIGCFLAGCNIGIPSKAFFAAAMTGSLGKRWPVQIFEALVLALILAKIWSRAVHFHQRGKIVSLGFIYIGIVKLALEPLKQDHSGAVFPAVLLLLGLTCFYKVTKQNPVTHLRVLGRFTARLVTDPGSRKGVAQFFYKNWYNQKASFVWKLRNLKKLLKRFNVKFS